MQGRMIVLSSLVILGIATLFAVVAQAESAAQEGLQRVATNLDNAKANVTEYERNLAVVSNNLGEIKKAQSDVDQERSTIAKTLKENNDKLTQISSKESDLQGFIREEQNQLNQEQQRQAELEKALQILKDNRAKREANINAYSEQAKQAAIEKQEWTNRKEAVTKAQSELKKRSQQLSSQEAEWRGKQKGYEVEIGRWKKEVERNQKLQESFKNLAEAK